MKLALLAMDMVGNRTSINRLEGEQATAGALMRDGERKRGEAAGGFGDALVKLAHPVTSAIKPRAA